MDHINEQPLSYWKNIFEEQGYSMIDCLRAKYWNNESVEVFYRQNVVMFVKNNLYNEYKMRFDCTESLIDVVHPKTLEVRVMRDRNHLISFENIVFHHRIIYALIKKIGKISIVKKAILNKWK